MDYRIVEGGGGLKLSVAAGGTRGRPGLLFLHGLSQTHDAFTGQLESALGDAFELGAFDLRGHGASEKPFDRAAYHDARLWAEDVAAVLRDLGLECPVLVAWSFGGIVALDYVKHFGEAGLAGLVFVGALVQNGVEAAAEHLGPGTAHLKGMFSPDFGVQYAASEAFVRAMTAEGLPDEAAARQLAGTMMTPPQVRFQLASRKVDHTETLRGLSLPVLAVHGEDDRIIRPSSSRHIVANAPNASLARYEGVGHAPFLERPERFRRDLEAFAAGLAR